LDRIVICGVPKSGTKLLNHMIHTALPDWDYTPKERKYNWNLSQKNVITKMPSDLFKYKKIVNNDRFGVIVTYRDPLYVLTSKHRTDDYWVYADKIGNNQPAPIKWYKKIIGLKQRGAFCIAYETLTHDPHFVQNEIGNEFDIEWKDNFKNYSNVPLPKGFSHLKSILRPIKTRNLKIDDLLHIGKEINKAPELLNIRKKLGYGNINLLQ